MAFRKGEGGRPRGKRNKATRDVKAVLDALSHGKGKKDQHLERLNVLTQSTDGQIAVRALTLALAYRFGQPKATMAVTGSDGGPVHIHHHFPSA